MIDREKLEHGSLSEKLDQLYAITRDDIASDPSIIDVLRRYTLSDDVDILEISILRLGVRAQDTGSITLIANVLSRCQDDLVRLATVRSLGVLYRLLGDNDISQVISDIVEISKTQLSSSEVEALRIELSTN